VALAFRRGHGLGSKDQRRLTWAGSDAGQTLYTIGDFGRFVTFAYTELLHDALCIAAVDSCDSVSRWQ